MSGSMYGNGRVIHLDTISAGEIETCRVCLAYARARNRFWDDLHYMRLWHADHTLFPLPEDADA